MLILCYFEYSTVVKKYLNKTVLNCGFGFAIANRIEAANLKQFINKALCDNVIYYYNSQ